MACFSPLHDESRLLNYFRSRREIFQNFLNCGSQASSEAIGEIECERYRVYKEWESIHWNNREERKRVEPRMKELEERNRLLLERILDLAGPDFWAQFKPLE